MAFPRCGLMPCSRLGDTHHHLGSRIGLDQARPLGSRSQMQPVLVWLSCGGSVWAVWIEGGRVAEAFVG